MPKEMVVSSSPHETKIAVLEDGQVVEVYYEREKEFTLAGGIYKGRVTRILPGMQSAFVNIGLERDAFLYVSDFLEGVEEYDRILTTEEPRPRPETGREKKLEEERPAPMPAAARPAPAAVPAAPAAKENGTAADERPPQHERSRRFSRRSRGRHREQPRGFPDSKYARRGPGPAPGPAPTETSEPSTALILLPGESFAKYKDRVLPHDSTAGEPASPLAEESLGAAEAGLAAEAAPQIPGWEAARDGGQTATEELPEPLSSMPDVVSAVVLTESEPAIPAPEPAASPLDDFIEKLEAEEIEAEAAQEAEEAQEEFAERSAAAGAAPLPNWEGLDQGYQEEALALDELAGADAIPAEPESEALSDASIEATTAASEASAEAPGIPSAEASEPREAVARERGGHPRYLRKQRFARRAPRGEEPRRRTRPERETPKPMIGDMLKEGQEIIVQVAKEPLGRKGARITSHIALPGRYVVYMPTLDHVGVSRKIPSDEERQRLKRIIATHTKGLSGGFIVRTAGVGRSEEDLRQDIVFLVNLWADIKARSEKLSAPALLHRDLDLVLRTLRDQLSEEFTTIWVDNEQTFEQIVSLVQKFQPALVHRVRLYTKDAPLFEETGVQEEINRALKPKVWLKSGGYIVVNQTEALVAIDVNTGKFVGKSNRLEDTIAKTNLEAIQEIVRQIRLRDLGGIIVIDFIDMDERRNRQKVMSALEEALHNDRAPSKILAFNEFGLVAITRKRVRQSLERTLCQPCSYCDGSGLVKTPATICLEILAEARKMAPELENKQITLRVNPEVSKVLKARDNTVYAALEEITRKGVIIRSDPSVHAENFYFD